MKFSKLLALGLALFLLLSCFAGCGTGDDQTTEFFDMTGGGPWTVGFGQVELTIPETEEPLYIAGYRNGYEITGVLDPLYATAVWLDCGGDGVLLIGIDCIGLSNKYVEDIRTDLAAECAVWGCAAVNLYATHTHAGIDTLGLWGPVAVDGKNDDFQEIVVAAAADAARLAYENRRPGTLTYAKADTGDIQRDSRDPQVYDPYLHQLRFRPDDGEGGVRMVSYAAHAESLCSENTWVSRDFPGVMAEILKEQTGDELLFLPAAVGGLIMTRDLRGECGFSSVEDNMVAAGRRLADCLLAISEADERPVEPVLTSARVTFTVPLDNTVFLYYRFLGILDNAAIPGKSETGYCLQSELSVLTLGEHTLALIPGEIFPELVCGGYLTDGAASPSAENPTPLSEIAANYGHTSLLICGLANDELGYIIPPNDFYLSEESPYFARGLDPSGRTHYEETNSVGAGTACRIAEAFEAALRTLADEGEKN